MTDSVSREPAIRLELTDFDAFGAEWDRLAAAGGNLFSTREWLRTWCEHDLAGDLLLIACARPDGSLAAILPLELRAIGPLRVLRFLGHGPSDQMGPISAPGDTALATGSLRRVLVSPPRRFQVFVGQHVPDSTDWAPALGARVVHTDMSPVLRFEGRDWDAVLASFATGLRKEIRYDARRLAREHDVRYRLCDAASLTADLDVLFALHEAQWGRSSSFIRHEAFHRAFARIALERGWLRLWSLEVDGRTVAVKFNFRYAGAEYSYQGGRDPSWHGPSLGIVNLANAMRDAVEQGAREYRFLRGGERYKFRFPVTPGSVHTVVRGSGALGSAAVAAGLMIEDVRLVRAAQRRIGRRLSR